MCVPASGMPEGGCVCAECVNRERNVVGRPATLPQRRGNDCGGGTGRELRSCWCHPQTVRSYMMYVAKTLEDGMSAAQRRAELASDEMTIRQACQYYVCMYEEAKYVGGWGWRFYATW